MHTVHMGEFLGLPFGQLPRFMDSCSHGKPNAADREPPPTDVRDFEVQSSAACIAAAVLDGHEVITLASAEYSDLLLKALPRVAQLPRPGDGEWVMCNVSKPRG
jgi:hypothetical protein